MRLQSSAYEYDDRQIGQQEVLLKINRQYDYIWETHKAKKFIIFLGMH